MSYKAILVHVRDDDAEAPRVACAAAIAAQFDAALIGVGAEMIPAMAAGGGAGGMEAQWFSTMRDIVDTNLKGASARFEAAGATAKVETIWESGLDFPGAALARASRGADLIVASLPASGRGDAYKDASPADLALTSGRPVLVAPLAGPPLSAKRIVLAWKDTREARRAMADAMPFLERAEGVLVLEVCPKDDTADSKIRTDDVVEALKRHGVAAQAKVAVVASDDVAEIVRETKAFGADLIVAGAYGHTRFGEWVFGGVTRGLLGGHGCYVILSH